jgi:hypothetical protein
MGQHSIGSCALGCPVVATVAAAAVPVSLRVCIYIAAECIQHKTRDSLSECFA